jgi:RNA polymerase sigma-70 factor (ECF subfamily)
MPPTDLIASAQAGDPAALASLLAAAQPDIRRYARTTCAAADVDDAVQDALCLLHRHIGSLRAIGAFSSWVFAVVRRECLRLAKRSFGATPLHSVADDLRLSTTTEPDLRLDLAAAIGSLPPHYRQVLVLRDIEERTIGEIADALSATRETIKARLHRARALVREYLRS